MLEKSLEKSISTLTSPKATYLTGTPRGLNMCPREGSKGPAEPDPDPQLEGLILMGTEVLRFTMLL